MIVLQFRPLSRTSGPLGGPGDGRTGRPRVPVRGTFTAPDLSPGSMDGWLRVLHCSVQGASLRCLAVVSGTLYNAVGHPLGLASTRCQLPVTLEPDRQRPATTANASGTLLVGPLEVNLLGFPVHVDQIRLPTASLHGIPPAPPSGVTSLNSRRRA